MKRNKDKRIFAKILIRYIICTVVFSIPLWVFADRYVLLIEAVTGSGSFYDIGTVIVTNLVLAFVITLIFMLRAARLLDREYDALDGIVDDDYVSPRLPNIISPRHKDVEEKIKKELKFKQYVANEAEQRKNDLVVYLAHDLKTPLTSIIGYLSLLDENPDFSVEYRAKYTGIALDKAYRLEQLINEFFDITRFNLQSFPLENNHIDLSLLLRQMAEEFYPVLKEKNLTCTVKAEDKVNIIGDSDKLSRVFDNLMRNASNYCYEGTNIEINVFKNGENAVVTFINQGDKIEKEKLDMIFEKFFRADTSRTSKTGGTGLGLAIAKQIVERHGGGSLWTLMSEGAQKLGIDSTELPLDKQRVINNLEVGNPVVCIMGPGDFTKKGHFIVMTGIENGKIKINDPNSIENSNKLWNFDDISSQINNLWAMRV